MTADTGDAPPATGRQALVRALEVRRYARLSVAVAAVFTVAVAVYFVVVVAGGQTEAPLGYYPALAFVVFVTTAMLATVVLVTRRVLALAVHPASLVRASATGGVLAGILWLAAANALFLGPGQPFATVADVATPWAPVLTAFGLWATYTRYKRTAPLPRVAALASLVALVGALAVADLAAVDLVSLLPDVGAGVDPGTASLFRGAAAVLVAGQTVLALLAAAGNDDGDGDGDRHGDVVVPLLVAVAPLAGLSGLFALGVGRTGIGVFAAGMAVCWILAGWRLRGVADADVPTGPALLRDGDAPGDDETTDGPAREGASP